MSQKYEKGEDVFFEEIIRDNTLAGALGIKSDSTHKKVMRGKVESVNEVKDVVETIQHDFIGGTVIDEVETVRYEYIIRDYLRQSNSLHRVAEENIFREKQSTIREKLDQKTKELNDEINLNVKLREDCACEERELAEKYNRRLRQYFWITASLYFGIIVAIILINTFVE